MKKLVLLTMLLSPAIALAGEAPALGGYSGSHCLIIADQKPFCEPVEIELAKGELLAKAKTMAYEIAFEKDGAHLKALRGKDVVDEYTVPYDWKDRGTLSFVGPDRSQVEFRLEKRAKKAKK